MTYTMTTTIEKATRTDTFTRKGLLQGDMESLKESTRVNAETGDTITHRVTADR